MQMSVTRALAELKRYDDKLSKLFKPWYMFYVL
jgi:hypothetical protein